MPFWLKPPLCLFRIIFVAMAEEVVPHWRCGAGGEEDEWDQAPSTAMADDGRVLAGLASEVGNSLERVKPTRKWATPFGLPSRAEAGEDPVEEPVMSRKKPWYI